MMEAPLLMKRPYYEYEKVIAENDGVQYKVPLEDTYTLDFKPYIKKQNPFNMIVVGRTGRQKTRLLKNLVKWAHILGYKILIFEPKSDEWGFSKYKPKLGGHNLRFALHEKRDSMPTKCFAPSFLYSQIVEDLQCVPKDITFYRMDVTRFRNREMWLSLGLTDKAATIAANEINKGVKGFTKIINAIAYSKAAAITKNVSIAAITNLVDSGGFDKKFKTLDIEKEWKKNNVIVISYFLNQSKAILTDIGMVVSAIKDIGIKEEVKTKKLIIFDDAYLYGGYDAEKYCKADVNHAASQMKKCQYIYRRFGIDSIVVLQNLSRDSVHQDIVEGRDEFLISKTGSSDVLAALIPSGAYALATNTNPNQGDVLKTSKRNWLFQWIRVTSDDEWYTGFPFDCTVGHPTK